MEFRKPEHTGLRRKRSEHTMQTQDGTPFVDAETMRKFRDQVDRYELVIPGLESSAALVGEDMIMWDKFIKREPINKADFERYYNRIKQDKIAALFGDSREAFAKYLAEHADFEEKYD